MERFKITTLVDITRTKCPRNETDPLKLGQQANFNSIIQAVGMRSNAEWDNDPEMFSGQLPDTDGKANYWEWEFTVERDFVFLKGNDPTGLLVDDLHCVPIVADLKNNVELNPAALQTKGNNVNTWVKIISQHNLS